MTLSCRFHRVFSLSNMSMFQLPEQFPWLFLNPWP
jgi:hypothetical protein